MGSGITQILFFFFFFFFFFFWIKKCFIHLNVFDNRKCRAKVPKLIKRLLNKSTSRISHFILFFVCIKLKMENSGRLEERLNRKKKTKKNKEPIDQSTKSDVRSSTS